MGIGQYLRRMLLIDDIGLKLKRPGIVFPTHFFNDRISILSDEIQGKMCIYFGCHIGQAVK